MKPNEIIKHQAINITGEAAERWEEFVAICERRGDNPIERVSALVLGEILMMRKLDGNGWQGDVDGI